MTHLSSSPEIPADGTAVTTRQTFSRETAVSIYIQADQAVVWTLLTDAAAFPRWNSTVVSLAGEIKVGETLHLKSTLDENRTFKLKVKEVEPKSRMVWGDRQGSRVYVLSPGQEAGVTFTMTEKIGGLFFPLYAKQIPPFDQTFTQFAADLKREAEIIQKSKKE